jgi:ABC-2 type transport system ATP-binding protein
MASIVKAIDLTKRFQAQSGVSAVRGLNLDIDQGELFGLVGPDGSGKTTTLRILSTVLKPTSGQAIVAGYDTSTEPEEIRRIIGYMPQNFTLYPDLNVLENLHFFADINGVKAKQRDQNITKMLQFTRLEKFTAREAGKLSGGMKKKLALACAMIHNPKVLFLDEPSTGVDPVSRRELWVILAKIVEEGVSIVVSTPYMDEAERCKNVAMLYQGELLAKGEPQHLIEDLPFEVIELKAKPRKPIRALLNTLPDYLEWRPLGDRLRLMVFNGNGGLSKFERTLSRMMKKEDIEVSFIRQAKKTMEDVFVHKVEKQRVANA